MSFLSSMVERPVMPLQPAGDYVEKANRAVSIQEKNMSVSRMKADKYNLDIRDCILNILEGIFLTNRSEPNLQIEGREYLAKTKLRAIDLSKRHSMYGSFSHFYGSDIDVARLNKYISSIEEGTDHAIIESTLRNILESLEAKFDDRVQEGILKA